MSDEAAHTCVSADVVAASAWLVAAAAGGVSLLSIGCQRDVQVRGVIRSLQLGSIWWLVALSAIGISGLSHSLAPVTCAAAILSYLQS